MYQRFLKWWRGGRALRTPTRRVRPGQWVAGVYHEPKSSSFMVLGQRSLHYRLYLPNALDPASPAPLIVMLHGCRQTALEFAEGTRMNRLAEAHGCAVLYPEQSKRANGMRCWNWFVPEVLAGHGESALLVNLLHYIREQHPIDASRVYVAGLSAGGAMAAVLCAAHAELFAACAIHSGLMAHAASSPMQALEVMRQGVAGGAAALSTARQVAEQRAPGGRLVPTLILHGAEDATVHPRNAEQLLEQINALAQTLISSGASDAQPVVLSEPLWLEAGGRRYRQQDLTQGSALLARSILIEGLGHAWSGGAAKHEFFDPDGPEASVLILEFLLAHRRS
jgi:poly(hydroxyalkanoate) depolymerase family esterase